MEHTTTTGRWAYVEVQKSEFDVRAGVGVRGEGGRRVGVGLEVQPRTGCPQYTTGRWAYVEVQKSVFDERVGCSVLGLMPQRLRFSLRTTLL